MLARSSISSCSGTEILCPRNVTQSPQVTSLFRAHQGDCYPGSTGSACTSNAVHVPSRIVGYAVIDDVGDDIDIKAAGGHIRSDECMDVPFAKTFHHFGAMLL
jgi:hypothetical protein